MNTDTPATASGSRVSTAIQRRIVVLDDETAIQQLLKMILEGEGYEVFTTDDGNEALKMLDKQRVDLVIQDLRMPKMDGLEFLKLLNLLNIILATDLKVAGKGRGASFRQCLC